MAVAEREIMMGPLIDVSPLQETELPTECFIKDEESVLDRTQGRLIAKLIALRNSIDEKNIQRRDDTLSRLSMFAKEGAEEDVTRFVADMRSFDARINRKPIVARLIKHL